MGYDAARGRPRRARILSFVRGDHTLAARAGGAGGSAWAHWRSKMATKKSAGTCRGEVCFTPQAPFTFSPIILILHDLYNTADCTEYFEEGVYRLAGRDSTTNTIVYTTNNMLKILAASSIVTLSTALTPDQRVASLNEGNPYATFDVSMINPENKGASLR